MEYSVIDNIVKKQKIKEEYFNLYTRLLKITPHTEDVAQWKENFQSYEEGNTV